MKTMMQKFEAALAARGERKLDSLSSSSKWTRAYFAQRDPSNDDLRPIPADHALAGKFYFVGVSGSLRIGKNKTESQPVQSGVKMILLLEDEQILAKR